MTEIEIALLSMIGLVIALLGTALFTLLSRVDGIRNELRDEIRAARTELKGDLGMLRTEVLRRVEGVS